MDDALESSGDLGDAGDAGQVKQADGEVSQGGHDLGAVGYVAGVLVFGVCGVAELLWGWKPGHTTRHPDSIRSAIDQQRVVAPQVLHQAPRP